MIFEPSPSFIDLRNVINGGLQDAAAVLAIDFISGDQKPWQYYAGVFSGAAAVATGITGAALTLYVVGDTLNTYVLKGDDSALMDIYLNGVATATIDLFSASEFWDQVSINLINGLVNRIDFVNVGASPSSAAAFGWMAISQMELIGTNADVIENRRVENMTNIISFSVEDSDGDVTSVPVYVPENLTLTDYTEYAQDIAPKLDAVSGGVIRGITLQLNIPLPGGLANTPDAGIENQRGANFSFNTPTRYSHTVRIPAVKDALFSGKSVNTSDVDVTALTDALINTFNAPTDAGAVIPSNPYGDDLTALRSAVKSFRKR